MSSFTNRIDELVRHLGSSASAVNAKQGDRVFNFHYSTSEWTDFCKQLPIIKKRVKEQGFTPNIVSFTEIIQNILDGNKIYAAKLKMEGLGSFPHKMHNQAIYNILSGGQQGTQLTLASPIIAALDQIIQDTSKLKKGVLILTDSETIHPMFRISAFEQILQGRFQVPTVICYPGEKSSYGDNPSFLGFYTADGNYRSTHIY